MMEKKAKIGLVFLLAAFFALLAFPFHKALLVADARSGKQLCAFAVQDGDEFAISFIHSVNKRPVHDYIKIAGRQLVVDRSQYDAFGAGMPENSLGDMKLNMKENGELELTNINRVMDEVTIVVGVVAQHAITIKGREIALSAWATPGQPLKFKVGEASYYQLLKGVITNG